MERIYTKTKDIQIVNESENIICELCSAIFTRHTSLKDIKEIVSISNLER